MVEVYITSVSTHGHELERSVDNILTFSIHKPQPFDPTLDPRQSTIEIPKPIKVKERRRSHDTIQFSSV